MVLALGAALLVLAILVTLLPHRRRRNPRKITAQEWADKLEAHLLRYEVDDDWDNTTSVDLADPRLDRLCSTLSDFDELDTPEKTEEFRQIIDALRRGEIPERRS